MALSGDLAGIEQLFQDERTASLIDMNYQDHQTGQTVLHGVVSAGNVQMVKWCIDHGIDVFIRDRKNRLAQEMTKNAAIKTMIKEGSLVV